MLRVTIRLLWAATIRMCYHFKITMGCNNKVVISPQDHYGLLEFNMLSVIIRSLRVVTVTIK